VIGTAQNLVLLVLFLASFVVQVFAIVDAARRPAQAFTNEGKLTKPIWLIILVVAAALTFALGGSSLFALVLVAPSLIYLADVRPRVAPYSRRKGGGRGGRSGGSGPSGRSGGW
jgi:uncharacterized membrane protein YgcG